MGDRPLIGCGGETSRLRYIPPSMGACLSLVTTDRSTVLALIIAPPKDILSGASQPRTPARGVSPLGIACGPQNVVNQNFDYHIRDQRGRFTPEGLYSKSFFEI